MPADAAALSVTGLSVSYGDLVAVRDATFSIAAGEAVAIIGPNGNGKSSLLMGIVGLARRRGQVSIFGASAPPGDVMWTARHGLTLVPERRQLYPNLSAADNVILGCYSWTRSARKARLSDAFGRALDLFPDLRPHLRQAAGTLSGGQQQMVAIARGLAAGPKILAVDEPCLGLAEAISRRVYEALAQVHEAGTTLIVVEEAPKRALLICDRRVEVRNGIVRAGGQGGPAAPAGPARPGRPVAPGPALRPAGAFRERGRAAGRRAGRMMKFGNLVIAGIVTGSIYAVFAVCVAVWYRVSNILNLAVGDFAMVGALGVDYLFRVENWPLPLAIAGTLAAIALFGYAYDRVVLSLAQDRRRHEGIVVTFFFTFALSFFIEGIAQILFGTNVHAAPALWPGNSLTLGSGLNIERAGILVLGCAVISGGMFALYIRYTLSGKAMEASGENPLGARIVGIDTRQYRRIIFVITALLAGIFGIVESPITGYTYISGATISLTGFIAAAYGGFRNPGRALVAGLVIGVLEALLGGYVSPEYGDTLMYAILAALVLARPRALGFESAVSN